MRESRRTKTQKLQQDKVTSEMKGNGGPPSALKPNILDQARLPPGVIQQQQAQELLVKQFEQLAELARAGELTSVVYAARISGQITFWRVGSIQDALAMLAITQYRTLQEIDAGNPTKT